MTNILENTAPIDPEDPRYEPLLRNLQGNILKGHGRNHAVLLFFRFTHPPEEVRRGLGGIVQHVTSAHTQLRAAKQFRDLKVPGALFANFFLSASGYLAIEVTSGPCVYDDASSFLRGMKRAVQELGDPPVEAWEKPYQDQIDAMLLLADNDLDFLLRKAREFIDRIEIFAEVVIVEHGAALRDDRGEGIEHFGFADAQSQPVFFDKEKKRGETEEFWKPFAPLSLALVRDGAVPDDDAFGSFLVYRKLEQDVRRFMMAEARLADALKLKGRDRKRAGAMVIGRYRDGTPLALATFEGFPEIKENDFDYSGDKDGTRCPFHAHIRKVNPRSELDIPVAAQKRIRIVRRAIPYGKRMRASELRSLDDLPSEGVGLLFMCFQSFVELQFNFIQKEWANKRTVIQETVKSGRDALIGQQETAVATRWPTRYGESELSEEIPFENFVKMKGGEYFFAPSMPFLRRLAAQAAGA